MDMGEPVVMGTTDPAPVQDLTAPAPTCPAGFDYPGTIGGLCNKIHELRADVENNKVELVSLTEGRCTANMLFIEALKEHKIAIDIVGQLIDMASNFDANAEPSSFAQTEAI